MASPTEIPKEVSFVGSDREPEMEAEAEKTADDSPALKRTVTAQDWTGPDDPENPLNWPMWSRYYHTAIPALMSMAATIGSSIYVPGIADLRETMGISQELALLGLTLWVLGLGFGPILAAPLSERYGRTPVYQGSILISALFTIGTGFSTTPAAVFVTRFFGGFFAGPVIAVGSGTIADVWEPMNRATGAAFFVVSPFAGPALGPLVGGFAAQQKGWQWTQFVTVMFEGAAFVFAIPMSETYKPAILKKRAKRLGLEPPLQTAGSGLAKLKMALVITLLRPLHMLVTEPIVAFFSFYVAFNFSILFAFFDAFPLVFSEVYGFGIEQTGLVWLAVLTGCIIGLITFVCFDKLLYRRIHMQTKGTDNKAAVAPEHRLYAAMPGSFGLPIGFFWLAWTARSDIHWICPVLAAVPFAFGNYLMGCMMYLVDTYGAKAGASASAANGLLRYTLGGVFPLFTTQMYTRLGIDWATSLFGFLSLLLLPIPWVLFKYGAAIRARSSYTLDL